MTIYWSLFVPEVVLLLYPADRLLSSLVELRDCFQYPENSPRYRPWSVHVASATPGACCGLVTGSALAVPTRNGSGRPQLPSLKP
jgi:hypothetical protein